MTRRTTPSESGPRLTRSPTSQSRSRDGRNAILRSSRSKAAAHPWISPIANSLMRGRGFSGSGNELSRGADGRNESGPRRPERAAHVARKRELILAQLDERRRQRAVTALLAQQRRVAPQSRGRRVDVLETAEQILKRLALLGSLLQRRIHLGKELELVAQALRLDAQVVKLGWSRARRQSVAELSDAPDAAAHALTHRVADCQRAPPAQRAGARPGRDEPLDVGEQSCGARACNRRGRALPRFRALAAQLHLVAAQAAALLGRQRLHIGLEVLRVDVEVANVAERAREPTQLRGEA